MEIMKLGQEEVLMLAFGFVSLIISWGLRIAIFRKYAGKPVIRELVEGTYPTTFYDLLSFRMFLSRHELPAETRRMIFSFVGFHWAFVLSIVAIMIRYSFWRVS